MIVNGTLADYLEKIGVGKKVEQGLYLNEIEQVFFANKLGLDKKELIDRYSSIPLFDEKLRVYSYLRSLGYVVRFDNSYMRIYRRGFRKGEDRTIYLLDVAKPDFNISYRDLSLKIELAARLRKDFILAIVSDNIVFLKLSRTSFE